MVRQIHERLRIGELSAAQNVQDKLDAIARSNETINALLSINDAALEDARSVDAKIAAGQAGALAGLVVAVKSNISVSGMLVNCASKTLENHRGTFDADVVRTLKEQDAIIIGMANCDEFACGSSGETSAFGPTQNPAAPGHVPGGSSSGSAAAVAAGYCDLALGSDTGGSIRNPASHCGVVGIKPSYGRVSRYGLVDMSMSLEGIGPLSSDVYGSALLLRSIAGLSKNDAMSVDAPVPDYVGALNGQEKLRVGLSPQFEELCTDQRVYELAAAKAGQLAQGTPAEVNLNHVRLAVQAYYPIVYVEFFSATRKFDGRRYGQKIEEACGPEVLRRILGGREISRAEYHGTYYRKALKAKELIAQDFARAFADVDVIVSPVTPSLPHKLGEQVTDPKVMYAYDALTIPANLAGICGAVVPAGKIDGVPVGLQILAPAFKEDVLVRAMHAATQSL